MATTVSSRSSAPNEHSARPSSGTVVQAVTAFSRGDFQDDVTLVIVAIPE